MSDINVYQGRTASWLGGPLLNADGSVFFLANVTIRFMVKTSFTGSDDTNKLIDHYITFDATGAVTESTGGWTVGGVDILATPPVVYSGPEDGAVTLTLSDEDTENLAPGPYPWEAVAFRPGAAEVYQLWSGNLLVEDTLIRNPEAFS